MNFQGNFIILVDSLLIKFNGFKIILCHLYELCLGFLHIFIVVEFDFDFVVVKDHFNIFVKVFVEVVVVDFHTTVKVVLDVYSGSMIDVVGLGSNLTSSSRSTESYDGLSM